MKYISSMFLFVMGLCLCFACSDKQDAIEDLRDLVEDIRLNGNEYTAEQWADAEGIFAEVSAELDRHEFTQEEKRQISELKGQYMSYIVKWKIQESMEPLRDVVDQLSGAGKALMEGLTGRPNNNDEEE